jgi:hypothetical protein
MFLSHLGSATFLGSKPDHERWRDRERGCQAPMGRSSSRLTTITLGKATLPVGQWLVGSVSVPPSPGCWIDTNSAVD